MEAVQTEVWQTSEKEVEGNTLSPTKRQKVCACTNLPLRNNWTTVLQTKAVVQLIYQEYCVFIQKQLHSVCMCTYKEGADTQAFVLADDQWPEQRWQKDREKQGGDTQMSSQLQNCWAQKPNYRNMYPEASQQAKQAHLRSQCLNLAASWKLFSQWVRNSRLHSCWQTSGWILQGLLVSLYSAGLVPIQHTVDILCKQGRLMLIYAASNFTVVDTS